MRSSGEEETEDVSYLVLFFIVLGFCFCFLFCFCKASVPANEVNFQNNIIHSHKTFSNFYGCFQ